MGKNQGQIGIEGILPMSAGDQQAKDRSGQQVREIPMFNHEQTLNIRSIFQRNKVAYQTKTIQTGAHIFAGWHAYIFVVERDQFDRAIELIKEYFGINPEAKETYSGECPACGAQVVDSSRCPDCDLNFSSDLSKIMKDHPFYIFLEKHNLL